LAARRNGGASAIKKREAALKKSVCALALCLGLAPVAANAADWSGFYVGANAGYGWGDSDTAVSLSGSWAIESSALRNFVSTNGSASQSIDGWDFGAQFGYNHQFTGGFVLGLEADYAMLGGDETVTRGPLAAPIPSYTFTNSIDPDHFLALKAKAGVDAAGWLLYGTAGWSMAKIGGAFAITSTGSYNKLGGDSEWVSGIVYGAGIERKFGPMWSARIEYLRGDYADFEYQTVYQTGSSFAPPTYNYIEDVVQDFDLNMVRIGVNIHF
jgi:outer membrane immunogenic protein